MYFDLPPDEIQWFEYFQYSIDENSRNFYSAAENDEEKCTNDSSTCVELICRAIFSDNLYNQYVLRQNNNHDTCITCDAL